MLNRWCQPFPGRETDKMTSLRLGRRLACCATAWARAVVAVVAVGALQGSARAAESCPALLQQTMARLQDEAPLNLCQFSGRVLLVVNTASYCGFTPQYEALEQLHARYAARGFTVLGFPSNDFRQEPKDNKTVADFCFNTYGVKFPMFAKSSVVGQTASPFFQSLAQASDAPDWNFHKYLLDRQGHVAASYDSAVQPLDPRITGRIEQLLSDH